MKAARIYGIVLLVVGFAIIGGFFKKQQSQTSTSPTIERVAQRNEKLVVSASGPGPVIQVSAKNPDIMQTFQNKDAKRQLDLGLFHHSPVQDMYRADGVLQLQMGVNKAAAKGNAEGQPIAGLYDDKGRQRLLIKLDDKHQSPMIVMRDMQGINRLIMGLNDQSGVSDPFLVHINNVRAKTYTFGKPTAPPKP